MRQFSRIQLVQPRRLEIRLAHLCAQIRGLRVGGYRRKQQDRQNRSQQEKWRRHGGFS